VITGDLLTFRDPEERDVSDIPSGWGAGFGASFEEGFQSSWGPLAWRFARRQFMDSADQADPGQMALRATLGTIPGLNLAPSTVEGDTPMLTADEANEAFAVGDLKFKAPISLERAADLYETNRVRMEREQIISRSSIGMAGRFIASLGGAALDPVNIAAGVLPGAVLSRTGLAVGSSFTASTTAQRVGYAATEGLIGSAALAPGTYGMSALENRPYTVTDALLDVAFGTLLTAGLHTTIGAFTDWRARGKEMPPVMQAVQDMTPEQQVQITRGAVANVMEGRPVNVAPMIEAEIRIGEARSTVPVFDPMQGKVFSYLNNESGPFSPDIISETFDIDIYRASVLLQKASRNGVLRQSNDGTFSKMPNRGPRDLLQFIADTGGVRDTGGDLAAMEAQRFIPGAGALVRKSGRDIDEIGEALFEAGYFGQERPTARQVLDAIDESLRGRRIFSEKDRARIDEKEALAATKTDEEKQLREQESSLRNLALQNNIPVDDVALAEAATNVVRHGDDPISALHDAAERAAMRAEPDVIPDDVWDDVPFDLTNAIPAARTAIARDNMQPYVDAEDVAVSREADDALQGAPSKARADDQGIGAVTPETRELDAIAAEVDAEIASLKQTGALTKADEAALAEADDLVRRAETETKARDYAAICLSGVDITPRAAE